MGVVGEVGELVGKGQTWSVMSQRKPSIALLGNNGISIIIELSMPLKCRIFNVEYLRQYLR